MSIAMKKFETEMYTKKHYQRLLSAKSTIKTFKQQPIDRSNLCSRSINSQDCFEYCLTNHNLYTKLNQIWKKKSQKSQKNKKSRSKNTSKSISITNPDSIIAQNFRISNKLLQIHKCNPRKQIKDRKKSLKKLTNLTRKHSIKDSNRYDQILLDEYRTIQAQNHSYHGRRKLSKRPLSSYVNKSGSGLQLIRPEIQQ